MSDAEETYWRQRVAFMANVGPHVKVLWGSTESQEARFTALTRICPPPWGDVLDIGCGFGDLFYWLRREGFYFRSYEGIDMTDEIRAEARRRHPGGTFTTWRFPDEAPSQVYDHVVASGVFSRSSTTWEADVVRFLKRAVAMSRGWVVVNFLSSLVVEPVPGCAMILPEQAVRIATQVTKKFRLHHDYRDNDMTLALKGEA